MKAKVMFVLFAVCIFGSALVSVSEGQGNYCTDCSCLSSAPSYGDYKVCPDYDCGLGKDLYCTNIPSGGCSCSDDICHHCNCYPNPPPDQKRCDNCGYGKQKYCSGGPYCTCVLP